MTIHVRPLALTEVVAIARRIDHERSDQDLRRPVADDGLRLRHSPRRGFPRDNADGLATVNFSHELRDNFTGGDSAETIAVNSVLKTLGQFPTITRAQLLVEGKPVDSLGGLLELTNPLPVLRPDASFGIGRRSLHRRLPQTSPGRPGKTSAHVS